MAWNIVMSLSSCGFLPSVLYVVFSDNVCFNVYYEGWVEEVGVCLKIKVQSYNDTLNNYC